MMDAPKVHVHMTVSSLENSRAFYEKFAPEALKICRHWVEEKRAAAS